MEVEALRKRKLVESRWKELWHAREQGRPGASAADQGVRPTLLQ